MCSYHFQREPRAVSTVNSQIKMLHLAFRRGQLLSKSEQLTPQSSNLSQGEVFFWKTIPLFKAAQRKLWSFSFTVCSKLSFQSAGIWKQPPNCWKSHLVVALLTSKSSLFSFDSQEHNRTVTCSRKQEGGKKKQTKGVTISKHSDDKKTLCGIYQKSVCITCSVLIFRKALCVGIMKPQRPHLLDSRACFY